jgi:hypothetical protein
MDHIEAVKTLAIERYLLEEMTQDERDAFEEHFFSCADCAEDVRHASALRDGVRSGLARSKVASPDANGTARVVALRPTGAGWRSSVALPWAAAALLAIGLGYQTLEGPLLARHQADSVALAPSTLRPASRGQEAVVSQGPGGIVTLAVDLGGAPFDRDIRYALTRADGRTIASGDAPLPSPGAPLLLMVPGSLFTGSEHFVLTLHNTGGANLTPATYQFTVRTP